MKKRYRVTRRGYIVFSLTGILILAALSWMVQPLINSNNEITKGVNATANIQSSSHDSTNNAVSQNDQNNVNDQTKNESNSNGSTAVGNQAAGKSTENTASTVDKKSEKEVLSLTSRIYFEPDVFDLKSEYYKDLDDIAAAISNYNELEILIEGNYNGYPGNKTSKFWTKLANDRAEVVMAYFVAKGIAPEKIKVVNNGCSKMINSDDSWEEIAKNRRVDVFIRKAK